MAKERKKSKFLGKFLAALIGFIIGILSTLGGIVGAGYYIISTITIKDGLQKLGVADYESFVAEEFASNTLLDAIGEISDFAASVGDGSASLSSLDAFSPIVREKITAVVGEFSRYGVPLDLDTLMTISFSGLGEYLVSAIDKTEIGKAAGAYTGGVSGLIQLICYGEENHEFVMLDLDDDGTDEIVLLGNNKATVLSDLTSGDNFMNLLSKFSVSTLFSVTEGDDDKLMRAIVYGEENVDYVVVEDEIQMLPRRYVFDPVNSTFVECESGKEYPFATATESWQNEELGYEIVASDGDYAYVVIDENDVVVEYLKATAIDHSYEVYRLPADQSAPQTPVKQLRRGLTVGDLMSGGLDVESILRSISLADLLDLNGDSDPIMLTIAYGQEGVDYTVDPVTKEITAISTPIKIGDLLDTDTLKEKLNNIYLADLLDISPLDDPKPDSITLLLAYGEEGVHYTLTDSDTDGKNDTINWLKDEFGNTYGKRTVGDLTENGDEIFQGISLATILNVEVGADPLLVNLAYGASSRYTIVGDTFKMNPIVCSVVAGVAYDDMNEAYEHCDLIEVIGGDDIYEVSNWKEHFFLRNSGDSTYYAYATLEEARAGVESSRLTYKKQMLSALRGSEANLFIEQIELGAALGITPTHSDKLMVAIAYGYNGEQFTISGDNVVWNLNPETGLSYRPRTLKDLHNAKSIVKSIRIGDFLSDDIDPATNPLMYTLANKGWTIDDISSNNINGLKLSEVIVIPEGTTGNVLYALRNSTIGGLNDAIKELTVMDVIGEEEASKNRFLKHISTTPIGEIRDAMESLTVVKVFEDKAFDGDGDLTGTWKYMLNGGPKAYDQYTFNDFDQLMVNISDNIKEASLQALVDDGVMTFSGIDLNKTTILGTPIAILTSGEANTIGELSLIDILTIIAE